MELFDSYYFLFAIPGLLLGIGAQLLISYYYNKYSKVSAGTGMTGAEVAEKLVKKEGFDVNLQYVRGKLRDNFNPVTNAVALSEDNKSSESVANIAVVAHEFGHVQQKKEGLAMFELRGKIVPAVNIGTNLGYALFIAGFFLAFQPLMYIGVALFSLSTIFILITLPIEFDASKRAIALIEKHNLVSPDGMKGVKSVLFAAALTYVAAAIQSVGQLLYYMSAMRRR